MPKYALKPLVWAILYSLDGPEIGKSRSNYCRKRYVAFIHFNQTMIQATVYDNGV